MGFKVFYAWQSDRDQNVCRFLIRDAANRAIKMLKAEAKVQEAPPFELDHATKGLTGHQHIASSIRKKVKSCDVFLADLTHVIAYRTSDNRVKQAQNPNVLIELGIAIRAKGFGRLVLVMNTAFGAPDDLPFDLKSHSFPITYDLPDRNDPQAVKTAELTLAVKIKDMLRPMLTAIAADDLARLQDTEAFVKSRRTEAVSRREEFERKVDHGEFQPHVPDDVILTVSLVPLIPPVVPVDFAREELPIRQGMPPFRGNEWNHKFFADAMATHNVRSHNVDGSETSSATTAIEADGAIFAACNLQTNKSGLPQGASALLNFADAERRMILLVGEYIKLLRRLTITGPLLFGFSLLRVKGLHLTGRGFLQSLDGGRTLTDAAVKVSFVDIPTEVDGERHEPTALAMKPALDRFWRTANYPQDPFIRPNGEWTGTT
ncbi:MAG TPA: hypothetical protein VGR35_00300 [Tepidisphaeraceae bacterium]|nr:hypothetical protein [Tepidisphaeraceae bacterium]